MINAFSRRIFVEILGTYGVLIINQQGWGVRAEVGDESIQGCYRIYVQGNIGKVRNLRLGDRGFLRGLVFFIIMRNA